MRVISGARRGLKLRSPEGLGTRPTGDRVKESVFNMIQSYLPADSVLDLFAGSGALGIEALSRGSSHAVFVDQSSAAIALVRQNLELCRFSDTASVLQTTMQAFLCGCKDTFDLVFLDPPYNKDLIFPAISALHENALLRSGGLIVAETERGGETVPDSFYPIKKSVHYGKTTITILQG